MTLGGPRSPTASPGSTSPRASSPRPRHGPFGAGRARARSRVHAARPGPEPEHPGLLARCPGAARRGRATLPARSGDRGKGAGPRASERGRVARQPGRAAPCAGPLRPGRDVLPPRLAIREKIQNERDLAPTVYNLAVLYFDQGAYPAAEPLFRRALALREKVLPRDHPDVAASLSGLAGSTPSSIRTSRLSRSSVAPCVILETAYGGDHPEVARCLTKLARVYSALGEFNRAEPLCRRALAIHEKTPAPRTPA